jgi:hypothetical protein
MQRGKIAKSEFPKVFLKEITPNPSRRFLAGVGFCYPKSYFLSFLSVLTQEI